MMTADDRVFMDVAIAEAMAGAEEAGIPIGASLARHGSLVSRGRNQRQQKGVVTLHGETSCLMNAGLFKAWRETTLYTTLSPCMMCAGAIVQFKIPRVVVADAVNFSGNEDFLRSRGVTVEIMNDETMVGFFRQWLAAHPGTWNVDVAAP